MKKIYILLLGVLGLLTSLDTKAQTIAINSAGPDSLGYTFCLPNARFNFSVDISLTGYTVGDSVTVSVNFGDGTTTTKKGAIWSWAPPAQNAWVWMQHEYTTPGSYLTQTIVTAPDGTMDTLVATQVIFVNTCGNLSGRVYLDVDNDCLFGPGDIGLPNTYIEIDDPGSLNNFWAYSDSNGNYSVQLPIGATYDIDILNSHFTVACPLGGITGATVPSSGNDLGIQCGTGFDLFGSIWGGGFRSGFTRFFTAKPYNSTCLQTNGTMKVILADPRISYDPSPGFTPAPTVSGDTLIWNFTNLDYTSVTSWWLTNQYSFGVLTDTNAAIGDTICMELIIEPIAGDNDPSNNVETFCFEVRNSFDPNEKTAHPIGIGEDHIIAPGAQLDYTVHFQNTGNDVAYNVFILDTLDENLDVSSLRIEGATHPMTLDLLEGNVLRFNFKDINLPDSNTNEPLSHGSVTYYIDQKPGLDLGTVIENTAYIFFDFNDPIITNTTSHKVDIVDGINEVQAGAKLAQMYPNPAKDVLKVRLLDNDQAVMNVRTLMGQSVSVQRLTNGMNTIDLSGFASGIYLIEVNTGSAVQLEKVIVQH